MNFWQTIFITVLSAAVGVLAYIIQQYFDRKTKIIYSARMIQFDWINASNNFTEWENKHKGKVVPSNTISFFSNWRDHFEIINTKLDSESAWSLFQFYTCIEDLSSIQKEFSDLKKKEAQCILTENESIQIQSLIADFFRIVESTSDIPNIGVAIDKLNKLCQ